MAVIVSGGAADTSDKVNRNGDVMTGPLSTYAMQYTTIPAGETITIPTGTQMIVAGSLTVDGTLVQDGTLVIVPDDALSAANNLSDVADVATARDNLQLGTAAVADTVDFDAAGAAAAVAGNLTDHKNATGTAVHGLGSASLLTAGTTGAAILEAATVDDARAELGLAALALPPRMIDHFTLAFESADVVGSGSASNIGGSVRVTTGATANSGIRRRHSSDTARIGYAGGFLNWQKLNVFSFAPIVEATNAEGVFYIFYGKAQTAALGAAATGNYVGVKIENSTMTALYACNNGTLATIAVFESVTASQFTIISENGAVDFYKNGVLIGSTSGGPVAANPTGSIHYEITNGATAAAYMISTISCSMAGA